MTQSNPMEPVFIGMVEKIVEEIFRGHANAAEKEKILASLRNHLEKAKRLQLLLYEGEAHNAIFIYKIMNNGDHEEIAASLDAAYDCAKRAGDVTLQIKILNNKGAVANQEYQFAEARRIYDEAIQLNQTLDTPVLGALFAYGNRIIGFMREADWDSASQDIIAADDISRSIQVTSVIRNDYARAIQSIRSHEVIVNLATGKHEAAQSALKLDQTLVSQLNIKGLESNVERLEALYGLIAENDTETFDTWHKRRLENGGISVGDGYIDVPLLQTVGQHLYAAEIAQLVIDALPENARLEIEATFDKLGIQSLSK